MKRDDVLTSEQLLEDYEVNSETLTIAQFIANKIVVSDIQKNIHNDKFDVPQIANEFCKKLTKKELAYLLFKDMTEKVDLIVAFESQNFFRMMKIVESNKEAFAVVVDRSEEELINAVSDVANERK